MFREIPRRGWALVAEVIAVAAAAMSGGIAVIFLAGVFFGAVAEEGFLGIWTDFDLDPLWRAGLGAAGLALLIVLGVAALFGGLSRLAAAKLLADAAEADRRRVAGWSLRRVLDLADPFEAFVGFAVVFLVLDGIAVVAALFALPETIRYNPDDAGAGFVLLAVAGGTAILTILLLLVRRAVWRPAWEEEVARARQAWNAAIPKAIGAERRARRPVEPVAPGPAERRLRALADGGWRAFAIAGGIAGVVFLVALYLRQPCRECDERSYDDLGEALIDLLARIAGPTAVVALLGLALSLVALWAADVLRVARVSRLAAADAPAPQADVLVPVLTGPWPGRSAGIALVGAGWGGAAVVAGVVVAGAGGSGPLLVLPPLVAVGVAGLIVLARSDAHAARVRNRMREAWSPGDVRPTPRAQSDATESIVDAGMAED